MDIIIGSYDGYNNVQTERGGLLYFLKSVRDVNKKCKIIVICEKNNVYDELLNLCKIYDAEIYTIYEPKHKLRIKDYRFEIMKKSLLEQNDINNVLIADMNDILFQSDPFDIKFCEKLCCGLEKTIVSFTIAGTRSLKKTKIIDVNINYDLFPGENIINCGAILGKYHDIMTYLEYYEEMQSLSKYKDKYKFNCQILLNIYIRNFCDSAKILKYNESEILTLTKINFNELKIINNNIVNDYNVPYSIIHYNGDKNIEYEIWMQNYMSKINDK